MKIRHAIVPIIALGLGPGLLLGGASSFAAAPSNGCPSGYRLLSVVSLSEQGYQVPAKVDAPDGGISSYGKPGNGDGWVCARQLGNRTWQNGPIYNFIDNQLP